MTRLLDNSVAVLLSTMLCLQAGCGSQPYPTNLAYSSRADRIVAQLPGNPPDGPPPAGKLDDFIAKIDGLGGKTYNPANLSSDQRAKLRQILEERFGTPAQPIVRGDADCTGLAESLQLQPDRLSAGAMLYKKHCLQCHGLTGDGRGPTGNWVYPYPRDFRQGVFKYVSSSGSARKPSRADIHQILKTGIDRTSMPSFALLSDDERDKIVAHTIHLSLRGEVEYRLLLGLLSPGGDLDDDVAAEADAFLKTALRQWTQADAESLVSDTMPTPHVPNDRISESHLESVRRGAKLFSSQAVGCIGCHVDYGRQARYMYDSWGSSVRVTDLTEGAYHGGKRPLDLFHRIRGGIGASGMPAATSLTEAQVWDLVHFVLALPTPSMLPAEVREQVYPAGR